MSKIIRRVTKVKIFISNVKAVLLCASESLIITQRMTRPVADWLGDVIVN